MNLLYCKSHIDNCLIEKCTAWTCADSISLWASFGFFILSLLIIYLLKPKLRIVGFKALHEEDLSKKESSNNLSPEIKEKIPESNDSIENGSNEKIIGDKIGMIPVLKISVSNRGFFDANNVKIEACFIDKSGQTFHILPDFSEFLIIPSSLNKDKNTRVFKFYSLHPSTIKMLSPDKDFQFFINNINKIRVRVHAQHSFSGFGKSFEQIF
ncbi:MAG: hypothetical protein RI883_2428 [Bacteroidota bacterium]